MKLILGPIDDSPLVDRVGDRTDIGAATHQVCSVFDCSINDLSRLFDRVLIVGFDRGFT